MMNETAIIKLIAVFSFRFQIQISMHWENRMRMTYADVSDSVIPVLKIISVLVSIKFELNH